MARFNVEEGDDHIYIHPSDYIDGCSKSEINEIIDIIENEYNSENEPIRSISHSEFINNIEYLKRNWYSLSKDIVDVINILAKNHGA